MELVLDLPDDRAERLRTAADRLEVTPEELAGAALVEMLGLPSEAFEQASAYVLREHADLYPRLG